MISYNYGTSYGCIIVSYFIYFCYNFFQISHNNLRFQNILFTFSIFPNNGKMRLKVGPKNNVMSSCTNKIAVFNSFCFH